jgi:hypothetical protein
MPTFTAVNRRDRVLAILEATSIEAATDYARRHLHSTATCVEGARQSGLIIKVPEQGRQTESRRTVPLREAGRAAGKAAPATTDDDLADSFQRMGLSESAAKQAVTLGRRSFDKPGDAASAEESPDQAALEESFRQAGMSPAAAKRAAGY